MFLGIADLHYLESILRVEVAAEDRGNQSLAHEVISQGIVLLLSDGLVVPELDERVPLVEQPRVALQIHLFFVVVNVVTHQIGQTLLQFEGRLQLKWKHLEIVVISKASGELFAVLWLISLGSLFPQSFLLQLDILLVFAGVLGLEHGDLHQTV